MYHNIMLSESRQGPSMLKVYARVAMGAGVSPGVHPMQQYRSRSKDHLLVLNQKAGQKKIFRLCYSPVKVNYCKHQLISAFQEE